MLGLFKSKKQKREDFLANWLPVMEQARQAMPSDIPDLPKSHVRYFIEEWNRLYEISGEEEKVGLAVFAYRLDIHRYAAGMLIDSSRDIRLSGIKILGYMRDESAWTILVGLLNHQQPDVVKEALNALFQINLRRVCDELLNDIANRTNIPQQTLVAVMQDNLDPHLCKKLAQYAQLNETQGRERIEQILQQLACNID